MHYTREQVEQALERVSTHADNVTLTTERDCLEDWLVLHARLDELETSTVNLVDLWSALHPEPCAVVISRDGALQEARRMAARVTALEEQLERHIEQAHAISHLLEGTGVGPCSLAEGVQQLVVKLAQAVAAQYRPEGDNHHNAAGCPYCNPQLEAQRQAQAERDRLKVTLELVPEWVEHRCLFCCEGAYVYGGYGWEPTWTPSDAHEGHAADCPRQLALAPPQEPRR